MKYYFVIVQRWSHGEKIMYTMCTYIHEIHKQSTCHIYCLRVSDNFKLKTELIISSELNFCGNPVQAHIANKHILYRNRRPQTSVSAARRISLIKTCAAKHARNLDRNG